MLDIIFSIPIHQRLEVVLDQICNIQHFNPNCGIVFHLSRGFDYKTSLISKEEFFKQANRLGNVFINPESVRTGFCDIIQAHMSNFDYVSKVCDFKYFAICASNESFIRQGLVDYVNQFDCGYTVSSLTKASDWKFGDKLFRDNDLLDFMSSMGYRRLDVTTPEGQFFKKNLMSDIVNAIRSFYDYKQMKESYPREEVYFSTMAYNMFHKAKVGSIFTYSAYHYKFLWDVTRREVDRLIAAGGSLFSVKRVNRQLNDNIRVYLRDKFNYNNELKECLGASINLVDKYSDAKIDIEAIKKNTKELLDNWKKVPNFFTNKWKQ